MTPIGRARAVTGEIGRYSSAAEVGALIQQAIIAAIEAEREACAAIVFNISEQYKESARQHSSEGGLPFQLDNRAVWVCEAIGNRIRARSNSEPEATT